MIALNFSVQLSADKGLTANQWDTIAKRIAKAALGHAQTRTVSVVAGEKQILKKGRKVSA